ncbi:MAG TPA: GNAT family N-acetyltransferase [Terracidiphilus sp.]|nr:GNAT family N-acetyltransferase [Terracidiphilus sp.]
MEPRIKVTDENNQEFIAELSRFLMQFNEAQSGTKYDGQALAIQLTHPESGEVLGGLLGSTSYAHLHVDAVFIPESLRGLGFGKKLMCWAEEEARKRGCVGAWLDTFSFQARGFYEKLGYEVFGELADNPPGHTRYILKKSLSESQATA